MFELKKLTGAGVDSALAKVERYRLLNEPWDAESICRDVLAVDPENQQALVMLLLCLTDQFDADRGADLSAARGLLPRLTSEYERAYYGGIICERWARRIHRRDAAGAGAAVYDWLRQAMEHFEKAEKLRPAGDDKPLLRWNTCARLIMRHEKIRPAPAEEPAGVQGE